MNPAISRGLKTLPIDIAIGFEYTLYITLIHFDEHYSFVLSFHDNFFYDPKFDTTPFLFLILPYIEKQQPFLTGYYKFLEAVHLMMVWPIEMYNYHRRSKNSVQLFVRVLQLLIL